MRLTDARNLIQEGFLGIRLVGKLASTLKKTIEPNQARAIILQRLEQREDDFIELAKKCIYDQPANPYLRLLKHAGCEYGDLESLVHKEGLESVLHALHRQGVYLTSKEFRGECETIRGNTRFTLNPQQTRNPFAKRHIPIRSSGSRSHGTQIVRSLEFVLDNTFYLALYLDARKSFAQEQIAKKNVTQKSNLTELATWSVPGGVNLSNLIKFICVGAPVSRWFSQLDTKAGELSSRYRLSSRVLELGGLLAGVPIPSPEYVSLDNPLPIIQWMKSCLLEGRIPHLNTFPSSAVNLAQCARDANIDLQGAQLTLTGEPTTQARLESIKQSNIDAFPQMGCVEVGSVGCGCLEPEAPDDMHLLKDLHAVIQPGEFNDGIDIKPQSLLFSTLRLSSPLILLNVSLGDQATLRNRTCGCPLGDLGLDTHLQHVRSFEKLTSGGMALLDTEIIHVIEDELPKIFGGGPTDYQLLEDERNDGKPQLRLVIHPRVGSLDEDKVKETFLQKVASGSGAEKMTSLVWRDTGMLTVERGTPKTTSTGKIQHMHIERHQKKQN